MQLGEIAEVKTGLVLSRKKSENEFDKKAIYRLISLKNISGDGLINSDTFEEFTSNEELGDQYFTKEGDVLIRLNHPHTAVHIDKGCTGLLVPSYFAIIKVHKKDFLPEFVAWYLNSFEIKKELEKHQSGTRIPSTNQNVLKMLHVVNVPYAKQVALVELYRLHQQEKLLYKRLLEEKELLFRGLTQKILKDATY